MKFCAEVYKQGINYLVDVPKEISSGLGNERYIFVKGNIQGHTFESTLMPRGNKRYKLFIKSGVIKTAGLEESSVVNVVIEKDTSSREKPIPIDLEDALLSQTGSLERFNSFSVSHKREFLKWLEEAKRPETRLKRIERILEMIKDQG